MTNVDLNKPLKARYAIEGVEDETELKLASKILFKVYDGAVKIMNKGGIDWFNMMWETIHPDWVYTGESDDDYFKSYERLFKYVANELSETVRTDGLTYKLRENEPCLLNFKEGYFIIYGYKDQK